MSENNVKYRKNIQVLHYVIKWEGTMDELECYCIQQIKELESIIESANRSIQDAPEGSLNVLSTGSKIQYYWRKDNKDRHGKYIKQSECHIAEQLAQKTYAQKIVLAAQNKKAKLEKWMKGYKPEELIGIYQSIPESRRKLITPYIEPVEEYVVWWIKEKQQEKQKHKKNGIKNNKEIFTEKGEQVRSKSEKIVADRLNKLEVPYIYEPSLYFQGYGYVYPDFIVLNQRTRKEYYWEHFGLMDNEEYCEKAIKKIEMYIKNHMMPGRQLIITYETGNHVLNMKVVEELIKAYLL